MHNGDDYLSILVTSIMCNILVNCWLKTEVKKKTKTNYTIIMKHKELHVLQVTKTNYKRNINMITHTSNLDFRYAGDSSVSDAQYILCYQTRKLPQFSQNCNNIYLQSMLAKTDKLYFLKVNVMN